MIFARVAEHPVNADKIMKANTNASTVARVGGARRNQMPTERAASGAAPDNFDDEDFYADEECYECGGDGIILNDCFEDTCCCADPEASHGYSLCPNCGRKS